MNFFATKQFNRIYGVEVTEPLSAETVHKGAALSIGGERPFERLSAYEQRLVVELRWGGHICDAEDFKKIEHLKKEIAQEIKREKQAHQQSKTTVTNHGDLARRMSSAEL